MPKPTINPTSMDIDFEIKAKNYEEAYKLLLNSSIDKNSSKYWYYRGVCATALTNEDYDKTTEIVACFEKLKETIKNDEFQIDHTIYTDVLKSSVNYWSGKRVSAYNGVMSRDKPDNINYGLQVLSGEMGVNFYFTRHSEKAKNISKSSLILSEILKSEKVIVKDIIDSTVLFIKVGFNKTSTEGHRIDWRKNVSLMNQLIGVNQTVTVNQLSTEENNTGMVIMWVVAIIFCLFYAIIMLT